MSKQQTYIVEIKGKLKEIAKFAGVWNTRNFPPRNVYPCAVFFLEGETNDVQGLLQQDHQRSAALTVAIFAQATQDPEKVEAELLELTDQTIKKLAYMSDPLAYIKYGGVTFGVQELDENLPDSTPAIHRAELRFSLDYCEDMRPHLGPIMINPYA